MSVIVRLKFVLSSFLFAAGCSTTVNVEDLKRGQVLVCHQGGKTLTVSTADFHRHQEHGDAAGPCPDEQS